MCYCTNSWSHQKHSSWVYIHQITQRGRSGKCMLGWNELVLIFAGDKFILFPYICKLPRSKLKHSNKWSLLRDHYARWKFSGTPFKWSLYLHLSELLPPFSWISITFLLLPSFIHVSFPSWASFYSSLLILYFRVDRNRTTFHLLRGKLSWPI